MMFTRGDSDVRPNENILKQYCRRSVAAVLLAHRNHAVIITSQVLAEAGLRKTASPRPLTTLVQANWDERLRNSERRSSNPVFSSIAVPAKPLEVNGPAPLSHTVRRCVMAGWKSDRQLDLRGKVCPYPTLDTRMTLKEMKTGEVLEVITDYYPARQTLPALAQELGYDYTLIDEDEPIFRFVVRKQWHSFHIGDISAEKGG